MLPTPSIVQNIYCAKLTITERRLMQGLHKNLCYGRSLEWPSPDNSGEDTEQRFK